MTVSEIQTASSKYSRVRGGLDNAVDQAEARNLNDMFIIDVDCHQGEPFSMFSKYLPEKYRDQYSNKKLVSMGGQDNQSVPPPPTPRSRSWKVDRGLGGRLKRPEIPSMMLPPGVDTMSMNEQPPEEVVETFTHRLADIGIKRCIIFPNSMLGLGVNPDYEFEVAMDTAYMEYMLDKFLGKYPEILSVLCTPANSPIKAAELIDRMGSEKGIVAVSITPSRPGPLAGDESWDPIYEAAVKKGLPICFHGETANLPPLDRFTMLTAAGKLKRNYDKYLPIHTLGFPLSCIIQMISLVTEGVPERFPELRFIFMEAGVTWIPWIMRRLDSEYLMRRSEAPILKRMPSEYIKEFYYSQQPMEYFPDIRELEWVFRSFDAENQLLYASDYPHWDFDAPNVIYDIPFLSKEAKKKILSENARKLLKIS